jgi:hypothetical protein
MNNLFILGYNVVDYFCEWYKHEDNPNTKMYFIDNGQQKIPDYIKNNVIWVTSKNIGCAGGWNLCCNIAFNYLHLENIIIGQEDARFSEEILTELSSKTATNTICGTYDNEYHFALFGIHKNTWRNVGKFDENFLFAGCEDNDYKHRCKLHNINIITLGISHWFNDHSSTHPNSPIPLETRVYNSKYLEEKWGNYTYNISFNNSNYKHKPTDMFKKYYGNLEEWPSETEFKKFKENNKV